MVTIIIHRRDGHLCRQVSCLEVLTCSSVLLVACRTGVAVRVLALSISRPGDSAAVSARRRVNS
jgi:hypothetical protein